MGKLFCKRKGKFSFYVRMVVSNNYKGCGPSESLALSDVARISIATLKLSESAQLGASCQF